MSAPEPSGAELETQIHEAVGRLLQQGQEPREIALRQQHYDRLTGYLCARFRLVADGALSLTVHGRKIAIVARGP